jgi:hypothetical protein
MLISDLEHLEEVTQASDTKGGLLDTSFLQFLLPSVRSDSASSANIVNYGYGNANGNTVISYHFSPIVQIIMPNNQMSSAFGTGRSGRGNRQMQQFYDLFIFRTLFGNLV